MSALATHANGAFRTWRTVKLGVHTDLPGLFRALEEANISSTGWADDVLRKTYSPAKPRTERLVMRTLGQLGFQDGYAEIGEIRSRILGLGLKLCPAEVAPALALQHPKAVRGRGSCLWIGMEPSQDQYPSILGLQAPWVRGSTDLGIEAEYARERRKAAAKFLFLI